MKAKSQSIYILQKTITNTNLNIVNGTIDYVYENVHEFIHLIKLDTKMGKRFYEQTSIYRDLVWPTWDMPGEQ